MMTITDDLGTTLFFKKKPVKIISLVPSISETLYDLNVEEHVVGVTKFCVHPAHFKPTKTIVGGTKKVNLEKIKELQPDVVFCYQEENTPEIVAQLQQFTQVYVTKIEHIKDSKRMISQLGKLLNRRTDANLINKKIDLKLADFQAFVQKYKSKKVAYFIWYQPWMVAANNTYIQYLLSLCNLENIYCHLEKYPIIEPKSIRHDGDPEVLLFSSEPFPFKDKHAFEISTYTNRSSAVFVDGEMFSWFGSRTLKAFDYLKTFRKRLNEGSSF